MTDIGKRIKQLREERELSMDMAVADINQKFNLNPPFNKSMISRWERQEGEPTLENARILSMYYDVSLDYLIGLIDVRTPSRLMKKPKEGK